GARGATAAPEWSDAGGRNRERSACRRLRPAPARESRPTLEPAVGTRERNAPRDDCRIGEARGPGRSDPPGRVPECGDVRAIRIPPAGESADTRPGAGRARRELDRTVGCA